jgi:hypothetical protein
VTINERDFRGIERFAGVRDEGSDGRAQVVRLGRGWQILRFRCGYRGIRSQTSTCGARRTASILMFGHRSVD